MHKLLFLLLLFPMLTWAQIDYDEMGNTPNEYIRSDYYQIKNCIKEKRFDVRHLLLYNGEDYELLVKHASKFKKLDSLTIGMEGSFCKMIHEYENKVLETMPDLPDFPKLRFLSLMVTSVKHLPKNIGEFKNLEFLEFSGDFEYIPESLWELKKLKTIRLSGYYTEISPKIYELPNLEIVTLEGKYKRFPKTEKPLNNWIYLRLGGAFEEVPSIVNHCPKLQFLQIISDDPILVDDKIGKLSNLEELHIVSSVITGISEEVGKLDNVKGLYLENTYLKKLPAVVFEMKSLKELILAQAWVDQMFIDILGEEYWPIPDLELPEKIPYNSNFEYIDIMDRAMKDHHQKQFLELYGEEVIDW